MSVIASESDKIIRKLRKKLRQIEHLESINRPLNEEEKLKVIQKESIRLELGEFLGTSDRNSDEESLNQMKEEHADQNKDQILNSKMKRPVDENFCMETKPHDGIDNKRPRSSEGNSPHEEESNIEPSPQELDWNDYFFGVKRLKGHNDLVCCIDMDKDVIISGSRDTSVRIWNISTGKEIQILRGHSNTVTSVVLLSEEQSLSLCTHLGCERSKQLALTASLDCCFKLWSIKEGLMLKSVYTYSGITALGYLPHQHLVAIGSEGGKLEIYSLLQDQVAAIYSVNVCNDAISCIKTDSECIVCSSFDGQISIWMIPDDSSRSLRSVYRSEKLQSSSGIRKQCRPIRCLAVIPDGDSGQRIFFGDEGTNIKSLSWRKGLVKKFRNHINGNGMTNVLCATKTRLLAACFDLDTGNFFLNVHSFNDEKYLFSVNIKRPECIVSLAAWENEKEEIFRIATGGTRLTLYEGSTVQPSGNRFLKSVVLRELSLEPEDSEDESSSSESEEDSTDEEDEPIVEKSSFRLCHIM